MGVTRGKGASRRKGLRYFLARDHHRIDTRLRVGRAIGRLPRRKQAQPDWRYLQVIKRGFGNRLTRVTIKVIDGDPEGVQELLGEHTAYVRRTHLTSRQRNGWLVHKALSFSKEREILEVSLGRLGIQPSLPGQNLASRRERRVMPKVACSSARAAGLMDYIWTVKELLMTVGAPDVTNTI